MKQHINYLILAVSFVLVSIIMSHCTIKRDAEKAAVSRAGLYAGCSEQVVVIEGASPKTLWKCEENK